MWCAHSAWCDRPSELLTSEEDIPHSPIPTRGDQYSFATPLLEKGTALCYIQTQLGHSTCRAIWLSTHVSTKSIDKTEALWTPGSVLRNWTLPAE
jgi:hypothetical protein